MAENEKSIYPERANYLSAIPCSLTADPDRKFVTISYEQSGGVCQLAFETDDAERMVAGVVEALAGQGSPLGMLVMDVLREVTADDDDDDDVDTDEGEGTDYEEAVHEEDGDGSDAGDDAAGEPEKETYFGIVSDPHDDTGDDFGPDA